MQPLNWLKTYDAWDDHSSNLFRVVPVDQGWHWGILDDQGWHWGILDDQDNLDAVGNAKTFTSAILQTEKWAGLRVMDWTQVYRATQDALDFEVHRADTTENRRRIVYGENRECWFLDIYLKVPDYESMSERTLIYASQDEEEDYFISAEAAMQHAQTLFAEGKLLDAMREAQRTADDFFPEVE